MFACCSNTPRYQHDAARSDFWSLLAGTGLTLVSNVEVASSEVGPALAAAFIGAPAETQQAAPVAGAGAAAVDEEELDDMI